jgi:hypothetical protein
MGQSISEEKGANFEMKHPSVTGLRGLMTSCGNILWRNNQHRSLQSPAGMGVRFLSDGLCLTHLACYVYTSHNSYFYSSVSFSHKTIQQKWIIYTIWVEINDNFKFQPFLTEVQSFGIIACLTGQLWKIWLHLQNMYQITKYKYY